AAALEHAGAVAKAEVFGSEPLDAAYVVDDGDLDDHVLHLAAVRPRVHDHRAPQRAGDADGEFEPGEGLVRGGEGNVAQERPPCALETREVPCDRIIVEIIPR